MAVRLPRFVVRQDVALRLAVQNINIVISKVDWLHPVAASVDYLNLCGSSVRAAGDQHRHQAYG